MKRYILRIIFSALSISIFSQVALSKNDVIKNSVIIGGMRQNNIEIGYGLVNGYNSPLYGRPYVFKIKNGSEKTIEISSAFIGRPVVSYDEISGASKTIGKILSGFLVGGIGLCGFGGIMASKDAGYKVQIGIGAAAAGVALVGWWLLLKLITSSCAIWKELMIQEPIMLAPGEEVEKIFWLKKPKDGMRFDFSTVKILTV